MSTEQQKPPEDPPQVRELKNEALVTARQHSALARVMLGLFVSSLLISLAAVAYVLVLASGTRHDEDVTHNAICTILAQSATAKNLTADQVQRLAYDDKAFACRISPSTVRKTP